LKIGLKLKSVVLNLFKLVFQKYQKQNTYLKFKKLSKPLQKQIQQLAYRMIASLSILLLVNFIWNAESTKETRSFDYFLLAQSWQAQFCYGRQYPGCHSGQYFDTQLTLHGMWPQFTLPRNGSIYPSFCRTSPLWNGTQLTPMLTQKLEQYWPNVKDNTTDPLYESFWQHEWEKHGLCTAMDQNTYLEQALKSELVLGTPTSIAINTGSSVGLTEIEAGYAKRTAISCAGKVHLQAIYSCWEKDAFDQPVAQIDCPENVMQEMNTCIGPVIQIQSF